MRQIKWLTGQLVMVLLGVFITTGSAQTLDDLLAHDPGFSEANASMPASASGKAYWEALWKGLTPQEQDLIRRGLLPMHYPYLKAIMEKGGKEGISLAKEASRRNKAGNPCFSDSYGDPAGMKSWAENNQGNEKLVQFLKTIKKGDIILAGPGKDERRAKDTICLLTRGPYHHSLICVSEGPPPEFIDATGNGVNRTQWTYFWGGGNYRIVRPTEHLPPDQAKKAVDAAVEYAVNQLGKPYDLGFTDSDGDRAFYCSELALKAYRDGAGLKELLPEKSAERDKMVVCIWSVIDALGPTNRNTMMDSLLHTVKEVMATTPLDWGKLEEHLIDKVLPACSATDDLLKTPANRLAAKEILREIREGKAFPNFSQAEKEYAAAQARGDFTDKWYTFGTGKAKQLLATGKKAWAMSSDLWGIKTRSGLDVSSSLLLIGRVFLPLYRNLGTLAGTAREANKGGLLSLPPGADSLLSAVDFLSSIREQTQGIPILQDFTRLLPGRTPPTIQQDFTSPTDLSQLSSWHTDYEPS
jgi:hypothetical protein